METLEPGMLIKVRQFDLNLVIVDLAYTPNHVMDVRLWVRLPNHRFIRSISVMLGEVTAIER